MLELEAFDPGRTFGNHSSKVVFFTDEETEVQKPKKFVLVHTAKKPGLTPRCSDAPPVSISL